MKRYLVLFSLGLAMGIICADITRSHVFIFIVLIILFIAVFIAIGIFAQRDRGILFLLLGIMIFFAIGAIEYLYKDNMLKKEFADFKDERVVIRGMVCSMPKYKDDRATYEIAVDEVLPGGALNSGKLLLSVYTYKQSGQSSQIQQQPSGISASIDYGCEIEAEGVIRIPAGKRNPGGMDYRKYLAASGISATMYVSENKIKIIGENKGNILLRAGSMIRNKIHRVINESLPEEQASLLNAMLTGCDENVEDDIKESFSDSGLIHIMAVSGMNICYIILPFTLLLKKLNVKKKIANPIIMLILLLYTMITGPQPSVLRAVIMAATALIAQMIWREADTLTNISLAFMLLLLWRPHMLFNIGFELSFGATYSIVLFNKNIKTFLESKRIPPYISGILSTTISAQAGILPLTVAYFNQISVISVLANLLVSPVIGIIIIAGMAMAALGQIAIVFARLIGHINLILISYLLFVSRSTASLPFAVFKASTPSILFIFLYYLLIFFLLWVKPKYKVKINRSFCAAAAAVFVLLAIAVSIIPGELEVVFLDVGEGDSAFVRTPAGKTILIDGGGKKDDSPDESGSIGNSVVIPFLLEYGVKKLDIIVATHGHNDHISGLIPVLNELEADTLIIPDCGTDGIYGASGETGEFDMLLEICSRKKINVVRTKENDRIKLGKDVLIEVLNPPVDAGNQELSLNNTSVVLKLIYKDAEILFTGDIEKEMEQRLAEVFPSGIKADVIKAAHHGSDTSSTGVFLEQVKPKVAVISAGGGSYGHPSKSVLERMDDMGIQVMRTDLSGAVLLSSDGRFIKIRVMCEDEH